MATQKPARPFYEVFLERVINIEAVQRYRAVVTDDHTAQFFEEGQRPGAFGDFLWSLDRLEPFSAQDVEVVFLWGPNLPAAFEEPVVSLPMQRAWDTAVAAWKALIAALANGELIAKGVHPGTGVRSELHPTEWARTGLVLNVRNGDLIEGWYGRPSGKHTVRWSAITLRAAIQEQKLGTIDWDALWNEDVALREKGQLPNEKAYVRELETRIKERYGVTSVDGGDLRRFKAALYRGEPVRPRKR